MAQHRELSTEPGFVRRRAIRGYSLKEFAHPPHRRLPWHDHAEASVCFVVSGSYTERMDGRDWECVAGTMVFKPPHEGHGDRFGGRGGRCLLIEVDPGRLRAIGAHTTITERPGLARTAALTAFGQRILRETSAADEASSLAIEGLILEILAEGSRAIDGGAHGPAPAWLRQAHALIRDSFRDALTLSAVARAVGVHPSHLARAYRAHHGCSVGDQVRRLRVEQAALELAATGAPPAEIALRAGFFDQSHFSRVFRRQTGLTPAEYRAASGVRTARTAPQRPS